MAKRRKHAMTPRRFTSTGGADLTTDEARFGAAMHRFITERNTINPTCNGILDVLLTLGYVPPSGNFSECVKRFTAALDRFKRRTGRAHPTWSEVLSVAIDVGWKSAAKT